MACAVQIVFPPAIVRGVRLVHAKNAHYSFDALNMRQGYETPIQDCPGYLNKGKQMSPFLPLESLMLLLPHTDCYPVKNELSHTPPNIFLFYPILWWYMTIVT